LKRTIVAVTAALCWFAGPAAGTNLPSCCACVEGHRAQTSGENGSDGQVYFCAEATTGDLPELETRCENVSQEMAALECEANIPGPSCRAQLADAGFACPAAGAPTASPVGLVGLTAVLAALGGGLLHRRRGMRASVKERS
jgi:hypothetical protein